MAEDDCDRTAVNHGSLTPSERSVRPFLLAWCLYLIVIELYGVVFLQSYLSAHRPFDFQSFYAAEYLARTNPAHLFDMAQQAQVQRGFAPNTFFLPFYHPSYEPFLLSPLSLLSFRPSYFVSIAFNLLLLLAAFFVARPAFSSPIRWLQPRPGLMLFVFIPVVNALVFGQDSVLSLLLYCLCWRQLEAGNDKSAGFFLALALFKFQIVLPVAALLAIRKGWRFTNGFLLTALGVVLFSVAITGRTGTTDYIRVLLDSGASMGQSKLAMLKVGVSPLGMPNLAGLLYACVGQFLHSPVAFRALTVICSVALFVWCARAARNMELKVIFAVAVLCGLLLSFHLFFYDLTLLLLPIALLGSRINRYVLLSLFGLPLLVDTFELLPSFIMVIPILLVLVPVLVAQHPHHRPQ